MEECTIHNESVSMSNRDVLTGILRQGTQKLLAEAVDNEVAGYIDAASQLMDYNQGLNPIGKCYVSGIGFNRVHNPHDRELAYTIEQGWGPRPGILVFGTGGRGKGASVPDIRSLPRERRFIDNLPSIQWTEFTIYQSLCLPAAVYPVLAQAGKWDKTTDPFVLRQQ